MKTQLNNKGGDRVLIEDFEDDDDIDFMDNTEDFENEEQTDEDDSDVCPYDDGEDCNYWYMGICVKDYIHTCPHYED